VDNLELDLDMADAPDAPNRELEMDHERASDIEAAFAQAEADGRAALKAAATTTSALKRYAAAAATGKVNDLRSTTDAVSQAMQTLQQAVEDIEAGWDFETEAYLQNGAYTRELIDTAQEAGLRITELDNRLYCYPALLRVLPKDGAVMIDKVRERRLRPTVLVGLLQDMQKRPARFKVAEFLESLYKVYGIATKLRDGRSMGSVIPLVELYDLLTTKPGDAREYSKQEFARDVYLLDRSNEAVTRNGSRLEFHAGAGAKLSASNLLSVVTERGAEKKYHGIAFSAGTAREE